MNSRRAAGLVVVLVGAFASEAVAEDVCSADVKQFCPTVKPGEGRVVRCLEDHTAQLSTSCRGKLDADSQRAKAYIAEFLDACHSDTERVCADVRPGGGRLVKCLSQHDYELAPACEAELTKLAAAKERVEGMKRLCRSDAERLCPGATTLDLVVCLMTNEAELSPDCRSANPGVAMEAGSLVDTVEEMTSQARIEDTIEILQGLNSVAFSRNQLTLSYDYFQSVAALPANLNLLTFNPLLAFGPSKQFAVQLKVPVAALFPTEPGHATVSGIADVNTAFVWAFYAHRSIRQYLAIGLQWNSASEPVVGAPWVFAPVYAIAAGLAGWVSLTVEVSWYKSFGNLDQHPGVNLLQLRPIVAFNLPSQLFFAVDTKLSWDFLNEIFVPVMRFQAGKLIGKERNVSIAAWYQLTLNTVGRKDSFHYGVGTSLSYFFDW